jgi:hypothetical protein
LSRKMRRVIGCFVALLSSIAAETVLAESLEPGRWRVLTTTLSGQLQPPMVATRCLTPEDVADPGKTFGPQITTENSKCEQKEFKLEPSGLTWRLECRGQLNVDVAGQFIFDSPTRYSAFVTSKATMLDRIVNETMVSISAERIGECR